MAEDKRLITEFEFHNYDEDEEMGLAVSTVGERIEIMTDSIKWGGPAFLVTIGQAERLLSALHSSEGGFLNADPADPRETANFHLGGRGYGRFFIGIWDLETDREFAMDDDALDRFAEALRRALEHARQHK